MREGARVKELQSLKFVSPTDQERKAEAKREQTHRSNYTQKNLPPKPKG